MMKKFKEYREGFWSGFFVGLSVVGIAFVYGPWIMAFYEVFIGGQI